MRHAAWLISYWLIVPISCAAAEAIIPAGWNARNAADEVMSRLVCVTAPQVKGAHDSSLTLVGDYAYVVAEVSEERAGESPTWPEIYASLSIVNCKTLTVDKILPFARGEQVFANETLPPGACFVPRVWPKDDRTLRCFFSSEEPGKRWSQTWMIDFDMASQTFANRIQQAKLKWDQGTSDLNPEAFYAAAQSRGFTKPVKQHGLYLIDAFKVIDGRTYAGINNFITGHNALTVMNDALDTFEIVGHFNEPAALKLTECAVNRLPDGSWVAICRQEGGNANYLFSTSRDGRTWTVGEHRDCVPNGINSKPTLDRFGDLYYLGWQEKTKINGVSRSVFNLDVSRDGLVWKRKYRFETEKSFQYPTFCEYDGAIWLSVTQGDSSPSRKERIMFGKLEETGAFASPSRK